MTKLATARPAVKTMQKPNYMKIRDDFLKHKQFM